MADIVVTLLNRADAPVRMLVGPDAVDYGDKAAEALAASDAKWRDLSVRTNA